MADDMGIRHNSSDEERARRAAFARLFRDSPIPEGELLANLGLYASRQTLSRMLFMHQLYREALPVHGIVAEFGVRWGQNLALFAAFRGMYEPFNYTRRIVGFDTFAGFPSVDAKDGAHPVVTPGSYAVTEAYEEHLRRVLDYHESESPLAHLTKYELVKGDATVTVPRYLAARR